MNTLETTASSPPTPVAPAAREPLHLRALRSVAALSLAIVLMLLFGLWLFSLPPMSSAAEAMGNLAGRGNSGENTGNRTLALVALGFVAVFPFGFLALVGKFRVRAWWWIGGGWLAVIPVLAYLAADEPSRRTITLDEMAPAFPGAEKSYAVLMRYSKQNPAPEAVALEKATFKIVGLPVGPDQPAEFTKFITERRADIEADWAALEPQRRWLDELNAFDRIGDLGAASISTDIIRFSAWRLLSQKTTAKAGLLALDGRGDEAIATLLPILEASRKLEPSARTLVRFLVARVVQRMLIETAALTVQQTPVSPVMRARLAAVLKLGAGGEAGARRLVAVDYAGVAGWLSEGTLGAGFKWDGKGGPRTALFDIFGPFVFNRQRAINTYGDLISELQELAARREGGKIDLRTKEFWAHQNRSRFKNFYGSYLMQMFTPALAKPVESYWKVEDQRIALLARLAAP
jgi:hypothetical protein